MHTCDCYCRTRVQNSIARPREDVQFERSRARRGSSSSVLKMQRSARNVAKRVPLIAARVVNDEQLDSKRSTATLPVSPVLSPGTTATLENAEKLIKDAEIQMKVISMTASCSRFQNSMNVRADEATFDDENDQLLYVRERVACKFEEANKQVLIDTEACGNVRRTFSNEDRQAIEQQPKTSNKRLVDLSAPKFQTIPEDRYEKFSKIHSRLDIQRGLGLALSYSMIDDAAISSIGNDDRVKKMDDRARSPGKETARDARMDVFSVRAGPSVNIKGDLVAQNVGNIHISPDPSFTRDNQNVGTYVVRRDFHREGNERSASVRQRIARIAEHDAKDDAETSTKRNNESNDASDSVASEKLADRSASAVLTNIIEKLDEESAERSFSTRDSENRTNLESTNIRRDEIVPTRENSEVNRTVNEQQEAVKITFKSEQKQVRFEERRTERGELPRNEKTANNPSATECRKNRPEIDEATRISEAKSLRTTANDKNITEQREYSSKQFKSNGEHTPLSSRETAEKHRASTEKRREIREHRYREIDERFANIVRTHCDRDVERSKSCEELSNVFLSSGMTSTPEASEESDNLDLYEPCINELDDVLTSYDSIIGNIVQSTRTIDEFLSRPELQEYRVENRREIVKKSNDPVSSNREEIAETEADNSFDSQRKQRAMDYLPRSRDEMNVEMRNPLMKSDGEARERRSPQTELRKCRGRSSREKLKKLGPARSRCSAIESRESPILDGNTTNEKRNPNEMERGEAATTLSFKKTFPTTLANVDGDTSKRRNFISGEPATKLKYLSMKDRPKDRLAWEGRASSEEETSAETSDDNSKNSDTKQTTLRPRGARLFRIVNDSSSLTASSICPVTSSTGTKSANDTGLSEQTSKLSNNGEFLARGTILKRNPSETKKEEAAVPSDVFNGIVAEKGKLENLLIKREDKATNILAVSEIVVPVSLMKCLLERLENNVAYPENFRSSMITERSPDVADAESKSEKRDSLLVHPELEGRHNGGETASEDRKDRIESIPRRNDGQSVSKCDEIASTCKRSGNGETDEVSCVIELEGSSKIETNEIDDGARSNFEMGSENSVRDSRAKSNDENLITAKTDDPNVASERCRITETSKDNLPDDVNKDEINLIENAGKSEEVNSSKPGDEAPEENSNENLPVSGERVESFVEPHSIDNTGNNDNNGIVKQFSQDSSDSLRDCASLRSSLKSLSNNTNDKPSQEASESNARDRNDDKIEKRDGNPRFDGMFEKEKILSDVYDEMNKKLFSSTCLLDTNTNHSSFLNQQRFSNGVSTISTIRSNKVEISSDTSHSEGELYMPSSGSYSLGEIRMLTKSRSDSGNIDNFDSNVAIFVTKEMLTSWSESSKSLVQSMGEI